MPVESSCDERLKGSPARSCLHQTVGRIYAFSFETSAGGSSTLLADPYYIVLIFMYRLISEKFDINP